MATKTKKKAGLASMLPALPAAEWEKQMVEHANDATAYGGGGVDYISTKGGKFTFNGKQLGQPLDVVILDVVRENTYFEGDFDPESPVPPACFAINRDEDGLAPPADLATKEAERCSACWANAFGSAAKGKGKACKNSLRMAVLPAGDLDPAALQQMDPALVRLAPTSLKHFARYAKQIAGAMRRPLFGVVTSMSLEDDDKDFFHFTFDVSAPLDAAQGAVVMAKREAVQDDVMRAPNTRGPEEQPKKKKPAAKTAAVARDKFAANRPKAGGPPKRK